MSPKNLLLTCIALLMPVSVMAAALTSQQILELHAAGVDDQVIIHQIDSSGVAFDPNASNLLDLRKHGLSNTVLDAVVRAGEHAKSPASTAVPDPVSDLYKAKKYAEVADLLSAKAKNSSASDRERAILILALLKLNNLTEAKAQYAAEASRVPASSFAPKLAVVIAAAEEHAILQGRITQALQRWNAEELQFAIETSNLDSFEKQELLADAAAVGGNFALAKQLLQAHDGLSFVLQQERAERLKTIQHKEEDFVEAMAVWEKRDNKSKGLESYENTVKALYSIAPLSPAVLDIAFYTTMITSGYPDTEAIGDRILAAKGMIRIPMESLQYVRSGGFDTHFDLVIDSKKRRLLSDGIVKMPVTEERCGLWCEGSVEMTPIDIEFASIRRITQEMSSKPGASDNGPWLDPKSYVLRLSPSGTAPQYAGMKNLHARYGEAFTRNAMHNLGAFVEHVTGIDPKLVSLVDPGKSGGSNGFIRGMAIIGTAIGASGSTAVLQSLDQSDAAKSAAQARSSDLSSNGFPQFSVFESSAANDLEASVGIGAGDTR